MAVEAGGTEDDEALFYTALFKVTEEAHPLPAA